MTNIKLTIPSMSDYVGVARLTASGIANRMKFTHEDIEDIKIAVSEACTNAVQYAYGDSPGEIELAFSMFEDKLEIKISDSGKGFDVEADVKTKEDDPEKIGLGLGIVFMRSLMDHVDYDTSANGTTVTLVKKVSS
ncbi:MAG: ATP-binding protein [Candidatus Margulisbacteria bacterium]|nr:ATP-binding protein [Candidatus Margulisiibacteriota bacterium]